MQKCSGGCLLCQLGLFAAATLRRVRLHVGQSAPPWPPRRSPRHPLAARRRAEIALLSGPNPSVPPRPVRISAVLAPLPAAMIFGFGFTEGWDELIRFLWAQPFGETEPLYGHDIAFYLFVLPFFDRSKTLPRLLAFAATAPPGRLRSGRAPRLPAGLGIVVPVRAPPPSGQHGAFPSPGRRGTSRPIRAVAESSGAVFGAGYTAVHVTTWALLAAALLTSAS